MTHAFFELVKQLLHKPVTNLFPVAHAPRNVHAALKAIESKKVVMNPPVTVPVGFRGKIEYDRKACIGCQLCVKVCPSEAIENIKEDKKIKVFVARCTFCALCVDICPKKCLRMSQDFLLANTDKYGPSMVVTDSGNFTGTEAPVRKPAPAAAEPKEPEAST